MSAAQRIGLVCCAPSSAVVKQVEFSSPRQPSVTLQQIEQEDRICRLCWGEEEHDESGQLICPCNCSGSLRYIHRHCLADWQRTLRNQGQNRRAGICELCKCPYRVQDRPQAALSQQQSPYKHLLLSLSNAVLGALYATSWPALAVRLWRSYAMANGIAQALRSGLFGFTTGLSIGKALVEEQASLLNNLLGYTSNLLGSPYAEMIWCQAVGALFVGMLSQLVYTSILGMLGGLAYGFCTGYVSAIKSSITLVGGTSCKIVSAAAGLLTSAFKYVMGLTAHLL